MKSKTILILLAVCAVLGAIAYFTLNPAGEDRSASRMGTDLFDALPVNDVAAIDLAGPVDAVSLKRGETVWEVADRYGYPADFGKITEMVKKLRDAAVGRSFPADDDTLDRLSLHPPGQEGVTEDQAGTRITLKDKAGKALADVIVGDPREASAGAGGHYLKMAGGETIYLVDQSFRLMETRPADWLEKELLKAPGKEVEQVTYRKGEETVYTLARPEKGKDPTFEETPEAYADRKVKTSEMNTLFTALSAFRIDDVADPAKFGEDAEPFQETFTYRLYDGTRYRISLGGPVEGDPEKFHVRVQADYEAPPEPPEEAEATEPEETSDGDAETAEADAEAEKAAEEARKKAAAERKEKQAELARSAVELTEKIGKWTYIVPKWRYENFTTDVADFFEAPPEPEADAETPEAGAPLEE